MIPAPYHPHSVSPCPPPHRLHLNNNEIILDQPSSFSSLSYDPFLHQHQHGSSYYTHHENQGEKNSVACNGSWGDHSEAAEKQESGSSGVGKKEEEDDHHEDEAAVKWMPSKMRIKRNKFQDHHQPVTADHNSSSSNYNMSSVVRVCSDCHTTKTPLWRSGPRGPKSLCNACGIRQRKARRAAMAAAAAAAASANGTVLVAAETSAKGNKKFGNSYKKEKNKSKIESAAPQQLKKKRKGRKKLLGFEDLRLSLISKNIHVFPQDEKEAAILLMALSYGLVHG